MRNIVTPFQAREENKTTTGGSYNAKGKQVTIDWFISLCPSRDVKLAYLNLGNRINFLDIVPWY